MENNKGTRNGMIGFLIIKCCACGKQKAFCSRKPLYKYECTCGQKTKLDNLVPVFMRCECGRNYRYMTNIDKRQFTARCPQCESPVEMELDKYGKAYVTMGQAQPVKRRKRR